MPRSKVGKALTKARGPVHGNFAEGATITQGVLALVQSGSSWPRMSAAKKEAIHMIIHKIHRIVTGNPDHKDHWDDIGGYGQLGADDCAEAAPVVKRKYKTKSVAKLRTWKAPVEVERVKRKYTKRQPDIKKLVTKKVAARPVAKRVPKVRVQPARGRPALNGVAGAA